jgi:hypothetical protein
MVRRVLVLGFRARQKRSYLLDASARKKTPDKKGLFDLGLRYRNIRRLQKGIPVRLLGS